MIWATEFLTTEIARSAWPFERRVTPAVFSTALPAIATITSPANAFGTPICRIAGVSAETNQSDTNAAPTPDAASRPSASAHRDAAA